MERIYGSLRFRTAIVGESFYKTEIKKCYKDKSHQRLERSVVLELTLIPEDNNEFDENAVGVFSKYGKVGHLSREKAKIFREKHGSTGEFIVMAKIFSKGLFFKKYGIWIDLDC